MRIPIWCYHEWGYSDLCWARPANCKCKNSSRMGCYTNNDGGYRILIDTKVFCPTQNLCLHPKPANSCWQGHVWMFNTKSCDYETFFFHGHADLIMKMWIYNIEVPKWRMFMDFSTKHGFSSCWFQPENIYNIYIYISPPCDSWRSPGSAHAIRMFFYYKIPRYKIL